MSHTSDAHQVLLSPHPHNVALSLGSICDDGSDHIKCSLITVFSRTDFIGPDEPRNTERASRTSGAEDLDFARAFSMARIDLGLPDLPLRTGLPVETGCTELADATDIVFNALAGLQWDQGTTIFAPGGEGGHADHIACREAAIRFGKQLGLPVIFYADMPYCIRPPAQVGPGYIFASGDREAWFRAVKCYPSRAALIEETVRLAGGGDGAPLTGAYLRPVQQHRPAEGASITTPTPTPTPTPRLTPTPTPAAGPSRPSANQPTPSDGLLTRLTALEQRLAISDQRSQAILQRLESFAAESAVDRAAVRELRDSVHYVARRSTLHRRRTRVLFLIHMIEAWDSYADVVRAMEASDDFEPIVASIPRHFAGVGPLHFEDEVHGGLDRAGVTHLRLSPPDMDSALRLVKSLEPDLIFRQSQWDADIPEVFASDRLNFARTCLVPYATMNTIQTAPVPGTNNRAVDMPYHRGAWVVFCANDLMLDIARRDAVGGGSQFRVVGHPKADRVRAATPAWPVSGGGSTDPCHRIVWSAHHSIGTGWSDFGAFHMMAPEMLTWARESSDTEFVFSPHPALIPFIRSPRSPATAAQFDGWLAAWEALPNTGFLPAGGYVPVLAASDLLITDGISVLLDYQLLEKPLIFFEREGHQAFNEIGELARRGAHTVKTPAQARTTAERLLREDADPLLQTQREITQRLFGSAPSAERILRTLRDMIAAERGVPTVASLS